MLIFVGVDDIGCDIGVLGIEWLESGDFVGFCGILLGGLIFKLVCR